MPFDPSAIEAPFRMQPGLRRLAAGVPQLHAVDPADPTGAAVLAAKLQVLRAAAAQALCVATDHDLVELNDRVLAALCAQAALDAPEALQHPPDEWQAPLLGWAVGPAHAVRPLRPDADAALGEVLRAVEGPWRAVALACLAFVEDLAVIEGDSTRLLWTAVCLPSHWAPEDKVGRPFHEVHAPVADNALLLKAAASLSRLVCGPQRWERFVWTLTPHAGHDAHPARWPASATAWPPVDEADADALAARAHLRTERQTFIPLAAGPTGQPAALFTIEVGVRPLASVVREPGGAPIAMALHEALASMSPAVLAYRGLSGAQERLRQWLKPAPLVDAAAVSAQWRGRSRFVVLIGPLDDGDAFLDLWSLWRSDPARPERLHVVALAPAALPCPVPSPRHEAALREALRSAWPVATPDVHRLSFDGGPVELLLCPGPLAERLPMLDATIDLFLLACDAPSSEPRAPGGAAAWDARTGKALARLAAPGAAVVSRTTDHAWAASLRAAGFNVAAPTAPGHALTRARYAPRFTPRPRPRRGVVPEFAAGERQALVIGAGLAGCSVVAALAAQGWRSTLVDAQGGPASAASGNPAGLFHSVVHAQDNPHARFNRACAIDLQRELTARWANPAGRAALPGGLTGLLRLAPGEDVARMHALLQRLRLPPQHVCAVGAAQASALAGLPIDHPAWHFPGGGWLDPAALASARLADAGGQVEAQWNRRIDRLARDAEGRWHALDDSGRRVASAPVVVLANAHGAARLIDARQGHGTPPWPLDAVRGQLSWLDADHAPAAPLLPVAGSGYVMPAHGGRVVFGATSNVGDPDPQVRQDDHRRNLARIAELTAAWRLDAEAALNDLAWSGRTAWRCVAADRLPLIGGVPAALVAPAVWSPPQDAPGRPTVRRPDQAVQVPRVPGLFVFTALGSRGIAWSGLGARVLAGTITGAPSPLDHGLLDAVDPARFLARAERQRASGGAA